MGSSSYHYMVQIIFSAELNHFLQVEQVCPSCGRQWRWVLPKAEEIEEEDAQDVQIQSQPVPRPKRMKLRSRAATNADTLLPASSQGAPHSSDFRRTTRSSARLRS